MIYVKNKHFKIYSLNENEDYSAKTYKVLTGYTFFKFVFPHTGSQNFFKKNEKTVLHHTIKLHKPKKQKREFKERGGDL